MNLSYSPSKIVFYFKFKFELSLFLSALSILYIYIYIYEELDAKGLKLKYEILYKER